MKNLILEMALALKELGENKSPITFDELVRGVIGADEIELDEVIQKETQTIEDNFMLFLDSIGVNEVVLNEFLDDSDEISALAGARIASSIANQYDEVDILSAIDNFKTFEEGNIEFDSIMPERKAGYTRKLVVRNGKKVWINKRNPNKVVRLTPKQKLALLKARMKAHTAMAEAKRKRSLKKRATFNLK